MKDHEDEPRNVGALMIGYKLSGGMLQGTVATVHKSLNMSSTPYINNMFSLSVHEGNTERITRSQIKGDVQVIKCRLELTKTNIRHRGAVYYNNVPSDARGIATTRAFVNKMRQNAKAQEYY